MSCKWQLTISSRHEVLTYMYDMPIWKTKEILFWKSTDQQKNDVNPIGNNQMKRLPGSQRHFFYYVKCFFFTFSAAGPLSAIHLFISYRLKRLIDLYHKLPYEKYEFLKDRLSTWIEYLIDVSKFILSFIISVF